MTANTAAQLATALLNDLGFGPVPASGTISLLGATLVHHAQGNAVKQAFGPWMHKAMPWLAKLKGLRGTAFDPFGRTEERRTERALVGEYRAAIEEVLGRLSAERLGAAVEIARLPEEIRGYGRVKEGNLAKVRAKWGGLMATWCA